MSKEVEVLFTNKNLLFGAGAGTVLEPGYPGPGLAWNRKTG